jgi:hypothetical protein
LIGLISSFFLIFNLPITFGIYVIYEMNHLNIHKFNDLPPDVINIPKAALLLIPGWVGVSLARSHISKVKEEVGLRRR